MKGPADFLPPFLLILPNKYRMLLSPRSHDMRLPDHSKAMFPVLPGCGVSSWRDSFSILQRIPPYVTLGGAINVELSRKS
jgi:hypothetical protein